MQRPMPNTPRVAKLAAFFRCDWLTPERARVYPRVILFATIVTALLRVASSLLNVGVLGFPVRSDYISFWAASHLALSGHAADVYNVLIHWRVEQSVFADSGYSAFFYPPVWILICLPAALLPFWWSLAVFLGVTGAAYWWVMHRMLPGAGAAILAYPAVVVDIIYGQNGLLTTALFGGALLALEQRPWLAGVCFGCLAYKPHLAVIVPIALVAGRHWRALASTAATATALIACSVAVFGSDTWQAFLDAAPHARWSLEHGIVLNAAWESTFRAVVQMGGSLTVAYLAQALVALVAITALVITCRRRPDAICVMLPLATLLSSPFLLAYDLVLLAIPMAWLVRKGIINGFLPWEKLLLCVGFILPLASVFASKAGVPLFGPMVIAGLLASATLVCLYPDRMFRRARNPLPSGVPAGEHGRPP